jgi:chromosome partitioning protein
MIVALLNQKGGVGKTTLALHLAGAWARQGRRVTVIDADPQGSALDWSEQRAKEGSPLSIGTQKGPPIGVQKGPLWYGSLGLSR